MLKFCLSSKKSVIVWGMLCCFLLIQHSSLQASSPISLSIQKLSIELQERDQSDQVLQIQNPTDEMIFFSALKTLEPVSRPAQQVPFSQETGSGWQTGRQNYFRDGYNAIESAMPPFEYKWRYQSNRSLRSPVIVGRNMYIPGEDGNVYEIDSRTGVYRDTIAFAQTIYSLHLADRHLIAITDQGMMVFDRLSRRHLWKYGTANSSIHSFAANDGRFYYATGHSVLCINQDTGAILWQASGAYASLAIASEHLLALSSHNVLTSFHLVTGKEAFRLKFDHEIQATPVYRDGLIYLSMNDPLEHDTAKIICLDYFGRERWAYPMQKEISTAVACDQQRVYAATVQGSILALDRHSGKLMWEENLRSPIHVSPTITSDHVFIGLNNGQVHARDKNDGKSAWMIDFRFPIYADLVIAQGLIYTVDNTGSMVAYGRSWENIVPPMSPENARGYPGNGIVTLYWSASKTEATLAGYHIYRKTDAEREFSFIEKLPVLNQYQDEKVRNGQRYRYVIRSYDFYGNESTNSSQISLTPSEHAPPVWMEFTPNNGVVMPHASFDFSIRIRSMNLPPGNYTGFVYFILYGPKLGNEWLELEINLRVQEGDTTHTPVPVIRNLGFSDTRVTLEWEAVLEVQKYFVYRSMVSSGQYHLIAELPGSILSYNDDTVRNGIRYYYALKASNAQGALSDFSTEASIIPNPLPLTIRLEDHTIFFEPVFILQGTADPKAKLMVNQQTFRTDAQGHFSSRTGIPVGRSELLVRAEDTEEKIQSRQIPVSFHPSLLQIQLKIDDPIVEVNQIIWPYPLDASPLIRDQRTFVPLRFLSEIIGASVSWNAQERKVTYMYLQTQVELWIDQKQIRIDGNLREIDAAPFIEKGRTMVPLRFITEPMGAVIQWDAGSRMILLLFQF